MKKTLLLIMSFLSLPLCSCGEEDVSEYVVEWRSDTNDILEIDEHVKKGTFPEYNGPTPTKEGDYYYSYVFKGWSPEPQEVKYSMTYKAVFEKVENKYNVYWKNGDLTLYTLTDVTYSSLKPYKGETPTRDPEIIDNNYCEYTFSRWSSPVVEGLNIIYNAEFGVKKTLLTKKAIIDYLKENSENEYYLVSTGPLSFLGYSDSTDRFIAACTFSKDAYTLVANYQCTFGKSDIYGNFTLKKNGLVIYECIIDATTADHVYKSASIREVVTNQCTAADLNSINDMIVTSLQNALNYCSNFLLNHNLSYIF